MFGYSLSLTNGMVSFQTSRLEEPMDTYFDIYRVGQNVTPQKIAFAQSLDEARKQVQELGASYPGRYLVLSRQSGIVVSISEPTNNRSRDVSDATVRR